MIDHNPIGRLVPQGLTILTLLGAFTTLFSQDRSSRRSMLHLLPKRALDNPTATRSSQVDTASTTLSPSKDLTQRRSSITRGSLHGTAKKRQTSSALSGVAGVVTIYPRDHNTNSGTRVFRLSGGFNPARGSFVIEATATTDRNAVENRCQC